MTAQTTITVTPLRIAALVGVLVAIVAGTAAVTIWLQRTGSSLREAEAAEEGHREHEGDEHGDDDKHDERGDDGDTHDEHDDDDGDTHDEGAEGEARVLTLTESAIALAEIQLATVARGELSVGADVPAEVQLNPERVAHVASLASGQLRNIEVSLGDHVKAGQRLAVVRSVAFGEARARLPQTQAAFELAKSHFARQKRLHEEGIASERAFLEAEGQLREARALRDAARAGLSVFGTGAGGGAEFALLSPIDGIIIERHATFGESIDPDDTLFVVADLSRVWVLGRLYEQQVAAAQVGAPATFRTHAFPDREWTGQLSYVGSTLDEATRTLEIRMELDNPDGALKPGMFARITVAVATRSNVLSVPTEAVQTQKDESIVFVAEGGGRFERREVTLGIRGPTAVEVLSGVDEGDEVVTKGSFILKSELDKEGFEAGHAH